MSAVPIPGTRERTCSSCLAEWEESPGVATRKRHDRRPDGPAVVLAGLYGSDGIADITEDPAHLAAQVDQRDDRDDGDEGKDQCVLRQTLAVLATGSMDESWKLTQRGSPPFR